MRSYTLALIKTGAVLRGSARPILDAVRGAGFDVPALVTGTIYRPSIFDLYHAHVEKAYFTDLVDSVAGPVVAMVLSLDTEEGAAVVKWREMMGATDPKAADMGTLRCLYGNMSGPLADNAVHGSDSDAAAKREIMVIFPSFAAIQA